MEEKTKIEYADDGVTLGELWNIFVKNIVAIIGITLVVAVCAGVVSKLFVKTQYKASATLIINAKYLYEEPSGVNVSYDNAAITYGKNVIPVLSSLVTKTDVVSDAVNKKTSADKNIEKVNKKSIGVSYKEEELLVTITYTTLSSKKHAAATINAIADTIVDVSLEKSVDGNDVYPFAKTIFVIQRPAEEKAVAINKWKTYTIIAALVALVLSYLAFFIASRLDDTVNSKKDIEYSTGFDVIAYVQDVSVKTKGSK